MRIYNTNISAQYNNGVCASAYSVGFSTKGTLFLQNKRILKHVPNWSERSTQVFIGIDLLHVFLFGANDLADVTDHLDA